MAQLKRTLGFWGVLAIVLPAVLGTGVFFGAHIGAEVAGNASLVSWLIVFAFSLSVAFAFAELAGMYPRAGGVYEFAKQTYGRTLSFIIGWLAWLMGNVMLVLLIVGGLIYLLPEGMNHVVVLLIASTVIIILNIIAASGIEESSRFVLILALFLFTSLTALMIAALSQANPSNIFPFTFRPIDGMLIAVFLLAESFFGWEAATYLGEETKDPRRTIPRAIIAATIISRIFVISLVYITFGVLGTEALTEIGAPITALAETLFPALPEIVMFIAFIVAVSMFADAAAGVVTMPRLLYSMAKDKLFLHQFSRIHPRTQTPVNATIFQLIVSLIVLQLALGNYRFLLEMLVPLGLLLYLLMIIAVPILRFRKPSEERTFKFPAGYVLPWIVALFVIGLVYNWIVTEPLASGMALFTGSLILLGVPIYVLLEFYNNPQFITRFNDILYPFLPKTNYNHFIKEELFVFLDDLRGKHVLEIGSANGLLTEELLEKVGPRGKVYASSFSWKELSHLERKLMRRYSDFPENVMLVHDRYHFTRIPPEIGKIDVVVSAGFLSYIQNIESFLLHASRAIKPSGKIIFTDYINHFRIIPDPEFLSDHRALEKTFRKYGFSIRVRKIRGFMHNRIIIYGVSGHAQLPFI